MKRVRRLLVLTGLIVVLFLLFTPSAMAVYTNAECIICHAPGGSALAEADFAPPAVDKNKCKACHYDGTGHHPGTGNTPYGLFLTVDGPYLSASDIHASHPNTEHSAAYKGCWSSCHGPTECQACHGDNNHTSHGNLTEPILPVDVGPVGVVTNGLITCANANCHNPVSGLRVTGGTNFGPIPVWVSMTTNPVCITCHPTKKPNHFGTITGTVKDENGALVVGAMVATSTGVYSTTTNAQGAYSFVVAPGTYTVIASKPGYLSSSKSLTAAAGATVTNAFVITANLAYNKTTVASSTSGTNISGNAVDGNVATYWAAVDSANESIYVDLGANKTIKKVVLKWGTYYGKSFRIEVSTNATSWTSKYSTTKGAGGTNTITFTSGSFRYVRMFCVSGNNASNLYLNEFEVYKQ